jgi:LCP family protein required for cell wall assembly
MLYLSWSRKRLICGDGMKPTEIKPLVKAAVSSGPRPDRVTVLLVWLAFILIAGLLALASDLFLRPVTDGPVAEAAGPTRSIATLTPFPSPTPTPTEAATVATISPTLEIVLQAPVTPPPCIPPDDWGIHVVQQGNTLFSLAQRYETTVDTLMRVNCLNTHTIFIGQRLYVPGLPATPIAQASPGMDRPFPTSTPRLAASTTPASELASVSGAAPTLTPMPASPVSVPDQYLNIVLLGSDKRPRSGAWRTDSMIIVSVDSANKVVRLLSLPRDLWVYIPGHGYNRINTADLWGELAKKGTGPDRVKQTIYHNLGIPIHYYVRVDFRGFMEIIDAVGGIDVDVDCPLPDINLSAGLHHMNGQQALRYARSRYSTNDFDRGRRQRKVLMALWDQALTLDIIPRLPELWWTMSNSFQTDLTLDQVINLAYLGAQLEPQRIISRAIGPSHVQSWMTPQGAAVLLPQQDKIRTMLERFYAPVDTSKLDAADNVRVRVLNGSQRRDADKLAASSLRWAGFKVAGTGNADNQNHAQTQIFVYAADMASAEQIAQELRVPPAAIQDVTGLQEQPDPSNPVAIQVILGRDYNPCER